MSASTPILMIEDSEDDAVLLSACLEEGGFTPEIRRVDTREKLREALSEGPWDVVISDYALPGFDGLRALAMVKEWDADVPFIMISGAVGEEFIVEAMRAGAQDFVSKDHLVRLAPSIHRELAETENRRARRRAEQALADELKIRTVLNELYQPLISPSSTMESIAMEVLSRSQQLTESPHGYVSAIDPKGGDIMCYSGTEMLLEQKEITKGCWAAVCPKGEDGKNKGLWGHSLFAGQPFFANAIANFPQGAPSSGCLIPIKRFMSVPVMLGEEVVGQIALANKSADYTLGNVEAIQRVAYYYALAIQRVRNEDQIRATLKEKQVMLQEIHHRVKNNLAIIISLLNLQANKLQDEGLKAAFADCQSRIRSMALIHQTLYQSNNLAELDLERYIKSLVRTVSSAYNSSRVRFVIRVDKIDLPLDYTIPCGLILNELVSNSIKHGFPNDLQGEIGITVQKEDDEIVLIVRDNGVGFARDMDIKNSETLGMFLIVRLGELQLGGKVETSNDNGAVVQVRFRAPKEGLSRGYKDIA